MNILRLYALLASTLLFLDRLSKHVVMHYISYYKVNQFFAIDLVLNRGMSFGMFHSHDIIIFTAVNILIGSIIGLLAAHTYARIVQNKCIIGEVLIFTGAVSNMLDRCLHEGVIDFIAFSYHNWHFAVFNIADVFICLGVCMMLFIEHQESWIAK
jgi:signal peptidase II